MMGGSLGRFGSMDMLRSTKRLYPIALPYSETDLVKTMSVRNCKGKTAKGLN
jgi:hypothetical protein